MDAFYSLPRFSGKLMSAQVSALLMKELKAGIFSQSDKLPSEMELAQRLGVSRTVIRDSLSDIEREGFVERVRGIGTVINREVVNMHSRLDLKIEYNQLISESGHCPNVDGVHFCIQPAGASVGERLAISPEDTVVVCKKRILADQQPVVYSIDYLSLALFAGIDPQEINWAEPIFDILERYCGLMILTDVTEICPVIGSSEIRRLLDCPQDKALLQMEELSYSKPSRPILYSQAFYTDFFRFRILRKKF